MNIGVGKCLLHLPNPYKTKLRSSKNNSKDPLTLLYLIVFEKLLKVDVLILYTKQLLLQQ